MVCLASSALKEGKHAACRMRHRPGQVSGLWHLEPVQRISDRSCNSRAVAACRCCARVNPLPLHTPCPLLQKLIDLQNTRGGRVKLNAIVMPETEYDHPEKGG